MTQQPNKGKFRGGHAPQRDGTEPLLELDRVHKIYNSRRGPIEAVRDVTLHVPEHQFIAILGPSGCGKSTMLLMIAGLLAHTEGHIRVYGQEVAGPVTETGIVFQSSVLLDWRTALQNVMLQVEARGLPVDEYRERAIVMMGEVGLEGFENHRPQELSGGMRQRVSLVRALIHSPPLLLMDEPFGALDAITRDQISWDLQALWLDSQPTVVFVTHSLPEAVLLADRVVVMSPRPGQIVNDVAIELPRPRGVEVRETDAFIGYVRTLRESLERLGVLPEHSEDR